MMSRSSARSNIPPAAARVSRLKSRSRASRSALRCAGTGTPRACLAFLGRFFVLLLTPALLARPLRALERPYAREGGVNRLGFGGFRAGLLGGAEGFCGEK